MITLDLNTEGKRIKFTYAVANIDPQDISGKFVMEFGNTNVSFPIRVSDNLIVVDLKTDNLFLRNSEGKIIKCRLEIIASSDTFLIPWSGELEVVTEKSKLKKPEPKKKVKKEEPKKKVKKEETETIVKDKKKTLSEYLELLKSYKYGRKNENIEKNEDLERFMKAPIEDFIEKKEKERIIEKNEDLERFMKTPIEDFIKKKEEPKKEKNEDLENFLNTPIEEFRSEKIKERDEIFSGFLDTPIEELID